MRAFSAGNDLMGIKRVIPTSPVQLPGNAFNPTAEWSAPGLIANTLQFYSEFKLNKFVFAELGTEHAKNKGEKSQDI